MENKSNIPTIFIILGATGDLMRKKIVPALFHLYKNHYLPKLFHVFGFSRRPWSDEEFRQSLQEILLSHHETDYDQFTRLWSYHQGTFNQLEDYQSLAKKLGYWDEEWKVCSNKLFYIAAPPQFYELILNNLHASGLTKPCSPEEGFTRVLVEKPFGKDQKTAARLEVLLSKLFKEEQIYRIDHYLAKEMLQNILNFRFGNPLFEGSWNNQFIEKVQIRLWETLGVEKRGVFYDGIGALRDVGQNHLLQMLALITMDRPHNISTEPIRSKRFDILNTLIPPNREEIKHFTYRDQYHGYHQISGVRLGSPTETYFKIRAFLRHPQWQGVPFILESGKRLKKAQKEIIITFKHPEPCFCPPGSDHLLKNRLVFQLEPEEGVFVDLWSKKPGLFFDIEGQKFQFLLRENLGRTQYVEEYEKLLLDSIRGDQTLFVRSDEVAATWKFIDPISLAWEKNLVPLHHYQPDTNEPVIASQYIDNNTFLANENVIKKEIGIIGLGKMGGNLARRLTDRGWRVVGLNRTAVDTQKLANEGIVPAFSVEDFLNRLARPRLIWFSLPAGYAIDDYFKFLNRGDVVIDGGNSYYKDSVSRAKKLAEKGIHFIDVGISGGPAGALNGASLMVGGRKEIVQRYYPLFSDLAVTDGLEYFAGAGAGHFVKMIHNGIEYGMMQAIAEGFTILKKAEYKLNLENVAAVYNHGSVIESKLVGWLQNAFRLHGQNLKDVSGSVGHTGEGEWTVAAAEKLGVEALIIKGALEFRKQSTKNPSYTGKILSALRQQFGGHAVKK